MSDVCLQLPCLHPVELAVGLSHAKAFALREMCEILVDHNQNKPIWNHVEDNLKIAKEMWKLSASRFSGFTAFYNPGVRLPSKL